MSRRAEVCVGTRLEQRFPHTGIGHWSSFSEIAFSFRVTPFLLGLGLAFAIVMGVVGGFFPALRAARLQVVQALR